MIDILAFYDQSEARITQQVTELIQSANAGQLDVFIDEALDELMNLDKKIKGGTLRIAKDGYQEYLKKDGLEKINVEVNYLIDCIVKLENETLAVKIEEHFKKCTDDEGLTEALEHMNIRLTEVGFSGPEG